MVIDDEPEMSFAYRSNLRSDDSLEFIGKLEKLSPDTEVGYFTGHLQAARGVWTRIGSYRAEGGSFIDPTDLMLYTQEYFTPTANGRLEALELNHDEARPNDALYAETVDELLDALAALDYVEPTSASDEACEQTAEGEQPIQANEPTAGVDETCICDTERPDVASAETAGAETAEPLPSRLEGMRIIEPDGAPEMHGLLTAGWHAMYYESEDGKSLLVFD